MLRVCISFSDYCLFYRHCRQNLYLFNDRLYNRYFNVKFVSLDGDYSTCSQVCPVKDKVILDMRQELLDKEIGLLQISNDKTGYYRADLLLKESELVLQATCQACSAGRS